MLKLKNVSKFYYNKGVIASGFTKVNIEFDIGEFVAIVGESGSGKSTLLNVISGLDSYEEGEMYIDGCETSHYRESDFEEYRKKYVSNIFQSFNLVNSYTVYQNVELVLLMNGYKKKDIKEKVLKIIERVGLKKYKNTLASKLSGGQKQRVAIARALAKDSPIIVCDEPTGNLDSKSAKEIIKLLKEISLDKLVIVVTHNLSEIEDMASRIVRMHDGKIVSDKKVKEYKEVKEVVVPDNKNIGFFNIIRLGFRNAFNIIPKFILLFIVFLFIAVSLLTEYGSLKKSEYEESKMGNNYYFNDLDDKRIIIKKKDGSSIKEEEFEVIDKLDNVARIVKSDVLVDSYLWFQNENGEYGISGILRDIDLFEDKLGYGRMPENDEEVVVAVDEYDYYFNDKIEDVVKNDFYLEGDKNSFKIKIVGVVYLDSSAFTYRDSVIYASSELINKYMGIVNRNYSNVIVNINDKNYDSYNIIGDNYAIIPSDKVSQGCAYTSEDINYGCRDYNCKNKGLSIKVNNLYYEDKLDLKICNVYNQKNVSNLLGIDKNSQGYGSIYINRDDYNNLFNKDSYQASVYVSHIDNIDMVSSELDALGYDTLQIRKTLNNDGADMAKIMKIVKLIIVIIMIITLFFISYFVIKLILKSRNVYFSTLRILGGSFKQVKRITDVELFVDSTLAYISYLLIMFLVSRNIIHIKFISNVLEYLEIRDYILMYLILIGMSYLISTRFAHKIFKKSAMKSYREEV